MNEPVSEQVERAKRLSALLADFAAARAVLDDVEGRIVAEDPHLAESLGIFLRSGGGGKEPFRAPPDYEKAEDSRRRMIPPSSRRGARLVPGSRLHAAICAIEALLPSIPQGPDLQQIAEFEAKRQGAEVTGNDLQNLRWQMRDAVNKKYVEKVKDGRSVRHLLTDKALTELAMTKDAVRGPTSTEALAAILQRKGPMMQKELIIEAMEEYPDCDFNTHALEAAISRRYERFRRTIDGRIMLSSQSKQPSKENVE